MEKFIKYKGKIYARVDSNSSMHPSLRAQIGPVSDLGSFCKTWSETLYRADLSRLNDAQLAELHAVLDRIEAIAEKAKSDIAAQSAKISKYVKK